MSDAAQERSRTGQRWRSAEAFERARRVLVGGVNSPARGFGAVGGTPVTVDRARGARIVDIDGNEYVDLVGTWGPAIVGHGHPKVVKAVRDAAGRGLSFGAPCDAETELAEVIAGALPGVERVRFTSSGTEAAMGAIRLARAVTGRDRIIKFAGNYHGHFDAMLVQAGSGAATHGTPTSPGVSVEAASATHVARYNHAESVQALLEQYPGEFAAVAVEPVAGNMGFVRPGEGFLERVRDLCDEHGAVLLFDEVMTGFRVAWGGYQTICRVRPDITCLGKVIGGGMPVGAIAGRADLMDQLSPSGSVYQAGTLSGNPVGMAAGLATLELCGAPGFYDKLGATTTALVDALRREAEAAGVQFVTDSIGGMAGAFFAGRPPADFDDARAADHQRFARFFHAMLGRGVWLPPSGFEAWFVSAAHTEEDIDLVARAARSAFAGFV